MDLQEKQYLRLVFDFCIFHAVSDGFYSCTDSGCVWPGKTRVRDFIWEHTQNRRHRARVTPIPKLLSGTLYSLAIKELFAPTMRNRFVITGSQNTFSPQRLTFYQSNSHSVNTFHALFSPDS